MSIQAPIVLLMMLNGMMQLALANQAARNGRTKMAIFGGCVAALSFSVPGIVMILCWALGI